MSNSFRFLHAADIHLDSPLKGLGLIDGAPAEKIRQASREAFSKLVDLAIASQVDFVLLAGDIFDNDQPTLMARRFFLKQIGRLTECEIPVYLIWGNHDAKNAVFKKNELPTNLFCFDATKPETVILEALHIALHGQSYREGAVNENLVKNYPQAIEDKFNIGLLHTSLEGNDGHNNYAPCDLSDLKMKGYDYWALGHIHQRQEVCREPYVVYPGNTQGRHIHESGSKGCLLVEVSDFEVRKTSFHPLDCLRWERIGVNVTGLLTFDEVANASKKQIEKVRSSHDPLFLVGRLFLQGVTPLHWKLHTGAFTVRENLEDYLWDLRDRFWLEEIKLETQPEQTLEERQDGLGDLVAALRQTASNPEFCRTVSTHCQEFLEALPEKIRLEDKELGVLAEGQLEDLLDEVQDFIIGRLMGLEKS